MTRLVRGTGVATGAAAIVAVPITGAVPSGVPVAGAVLRFLAVLAALLLPSCPHMANVHLRPSSCTMST
jgi:hypothetical protein